MYNSGPSAETLERYFLPSTNMHSTISNVLTPNLTNKYVYVKQDLVNSSHHQETVIPKVLVNPHFKKKVFVNPNFNVNNVLPHTSVPKIHVNPNVQKLNLNINKECTGVQKIHINPNVLRNVPVSLNNSTNNSIEETEMKEPIKNISHTIVSTRTKFIRSPMKMISSNNKPRKRRLSIKSKFKIIRSSVLLSPADKSKRKRRASVLSKYKIVKSTCSKQNYEQGSKNRRPVINKFKLDNRNNKISCPKNKKYVYVNRFLSISDLARTSLLKQNYKTKSGVLNTSGILYKKSPNSLNRIFDNYKKTNMKKSQENSICKSKYKFIRKSMDRAKANENNVTSVLKQLKVLRTPKIKKNASPGKLRKCNIPCPYYRKFGRCKGKDNGKCFRKHDPDQIALCTKFLQGACIDKKCLLSHNVSPEKMPTCKFYLEGSCSRDDCPYLHVRINPKADICRDFLEGFCRKAAKCDKRHQFLCPDYEKNGSCLKQRCPYPHGKMVRKYSVFNKNKFAKKSSDSKKEIKSSVKGKESGIIGKNCMNPKSENFIANTEVNIKTRYYVEQSVPAEENCQEASSSEQKSSDNTAYCDQETGIRFRPKLGKLPSFIAFEEV